MNEFEKAANIMNLLKTVLRSEHSHPFMASLYAPLVAADLGEARHRMREPGGGLRHAILPGLAGGALAMMMMQHLADPVSKYMASRNLTSAPAIGQHLLEGAKGFLGKLRS
jgi:hypothetical protein